MIEQIDWPKTGKSLSPFMKGKHERRLKITFHSQSFVGLSAEEAEALKALYELSHLRVIKAIQTTEGEFPHLKIGELNSNAEHIPVNVYYKNGKNLSTGIPAPHIWPQIAQQLAHAFQADPKCLDPKNVLNDLLVA